MRVPTTSLHCSIASTWYELMVDGEHGLARGGILRDVLRYACIDLLRTVCRIVLYSISYCEVPIQ